MAKKSLVRRLENIHKKLSKKNQIYRTVTSDKKAHVFVVDFDEVYDQVIIQLTEGGGTSGRGRIGPNALKDHKTFFRGDLKKATKKFVADMFKGFTAKEAGYKKGDKYIVTCSGTETTFQAEYVKIAKGGPGNIFKDIKKVKQDAQKDLVNVIDDYIISNQGGSTKDVKTFQSKRISRKTGKEQDSPYYFLELGHDEDGSSISQQKISQAKLDVAKALSDNKLQEISPENSLLRDTAAGLFLTSDTTGPKEVLHCGIESNYINRSKAFVEKGQQKSVEDDLAAIINEINAEDWGEHSASDTVLQRREKKILNALLTGLPHGKYVKTNIKYQKPKDSKVTVDNVKQYKVSKLNPGNTLATPVTVGKKRPSGKTARKRSNFNMLAMINQKLPATVKKNMGFPALENRTGRFANSVRLVDASQTPQGYPSFGYTYERNPYQVFETGSRGNWASRERDPRRLIDTSIREVAAELALGRFYTRRV